MKNAPMAQKFSDQGGKTTFATLSAKSRHSALGKERRYSITSSAVKMNDGAIVNPSGRH
jgi:hypothetical protein